MKINDIILEYASREEMAAEFDGEYGNPKLPEYFHIDKSRVVARAFVLQKNAGVSPGGAIRQATRDLYPTKPSTKDDRPADKKDKTSPEYKQKDKDEFVSKRKSKLNAKDKPNNQKDTSSDGWEDETFVDQLKRRVATGWARGQALANYNVAPKSR